MAENSLSSWFPGDPEQRANWMRSLARSPATILGAPVDSMNAIIGVLNALGGGRSPVNATERPVGGSQWLAEHLGMPSEPGSPYADFGLSLVGPGGAVKAARGLGDLEEALLSAKPGPVAGSPAAQGGMVNFDPRFDPRAKEAEKLAALQIGVAPRPMLPAPSVSLANFEGSPFITSMSDRTAAGGRLEKINDVALTRPVDLRGGQDFMFDNQGQVWASAKNPVNQMHELAGNLKRVTGKDPLLIPWRMAPSGGDFASMTGEAMLAHAASAMGKKERSGVDRLVKTFIPNWSGVASEASVKQFRDAPDAVRKAIKNALDVEFRDRGGLSLGEARLSVADPKQLMGADGQIMNVGRIDSGRPIVAQSGHPSYPRGLPGEGIGRIDEAHNIYELLPSVGQARGLNDLANPRTTDLRALQMKPYAGIIDADLLKTLGY